MIAEKYIEEINIQGREVNYRGKLLVKTLFNIFNDVASQQSYKYGVGVDVLNQRGTTWMLHSIRVSINEWPKRCDTISVETWPYEVNSIFVVRYFRVLCEGKVMAEAVTEWMYVDLERRRPLRQLPEVVEMCNKELGCINLPSFERNTELAQMQNCQNFKATFDNIDFNKHVTQASYVGWAINSLPFEFLKTHELEYVEAIYSHEVLPDAIVKAYYGISYKDDVAYSQHNVLNDDSSLVHCSLRAKWRNC